MKKTIRKCIFFVMMSCVVLPAFAFDEGFVWGLKANFNGTATIPSINQSDLDKLGASYMKGAVGYSMDGEAELGYLFGAERWFGVTPLAFSGVSLYGSIGVGNGFTGQVAGGTHNETSADVYVNIHFTPVISFGVGSKAYFFNNKLSAGLWLGSKLIADLSPSYLAYASDPALIKNNVGEIIVDDFMMKNMNPFAFSTKFSFEYHQPVNHNVEVTLGTYMRFNVYSPKYITLPNELLDLLNSTKPDGEKFSVKTPLPSYYLNSLDFGISVGLSFKG